MNLNSHYIVLLKSPRDKQQISILAQQISILAQQINSGCVQQFMETYDEATSRPHRYLMLDLKPTTSDQGQLKANVLPSKNASLTNYFQK